MHVHSSVSVPRLLFSLIALFAAGMTAAQGIPDQRNVNIIGSLPPEGGIPEANKQQNEAACSRKSSNPLHVLCVFNDYRGVDYPGIGDAWEGWSWSVNGMETSYSDLLPGHPGDTPNVGFGFAADPYVTAGPGIALVSYIVTNRGDNQPGALLLHRLFEVNREAGTPWAPEMLPKTVVNGTKKKFVDKPFQLWHLAEPGSGTVMVNSTLKDGSSISQEVPAGRVFLAYTTFLNNISTMSVAYTDDYGESFIIEEISEGKSINQGASLAAHDDNVCAVWRRFDNFSTIRRGNGNGKGHDKGKGKGHEIGKGKGHYGDGDPGVGQTTDDAIMVSCSTNRGNDWATPNELFASPDFIPFDQGTTSTSFRFNSYPSIVSDGSIFYAVWSQRKDTGLFYGRIVFSMSEDNGNTWSAPVMIEDHGSGHQLWPTIAVARGTVQLAWQDTRYDLFQSVFIQDSLDPDSGEPATKVIRQLGDIRTAQIESGMVLYPSAEVSRYLHGVLPDDPTGTVPYKLQQHFENDRIFNQGQEPFNGDYPHISAPPFRLQDGDWVSNQTPGPDGRPDEFLMTWTDNRDVKGNVWENLSDPTVFTPGGSAGGGTAIDEDDGKPFAEGDNPEAVATTMQGRNPDAVAVAKADGSSSRSYKVTGASAINDDASADSEPDPPQDVYLMCDPVNSQNRDLSRDQNVYGSIIRPGVSLESPSANKPTGSVQRAHVIWVSNNNPDPVVYTLSIDSQPVDAPDDGRASFVQAPIAPFDVNDPTGAGLVTEMQAHIDPNSSIARTVFISSLLPDTPVDVSVTGPDGMGGTKVLGQITLNPDPLTPDLEMPNVQNQNPTDILDGEEHNPNVQNGVITAVVLGNPNVQNPNVQNYDPLNPNVQNPNVQNFGGPNPNVQNPNVQNQTPVGSSTENPDTAFPGVTDDDSGTGVREDGYMDITWPVDVEYVESTDPDEAKDGANTTTAFNYDAFLNGDTEGLRTQLIGYRTQLTESSRDCMPILEVQKQVVFNVLDPDLDYAAEKATAGFHVDGSAYSAPNEEFYVTLRVWGITDQDHVDEIFDNAGLEAESQSCNTPDVLPGDTECEPPSSIDGTPDAPPVITVVGDLTIEADNNGDGDIGDYSDIEVTVSDDIDLDLFLECVNDDDDDSANYNNLGDGVVNIMRFFDFEPQEPISVEFTCTTAADSGGNIAVEVFTVVSVDTMAPVLSFEDEDADGDTDFDFFTDSAPVNVDFQIFGSEHVTAEDFNDVDELPLIECMPASDSSFMDGRTTVSCTATDDEGNVSDPETFDVVVEVDA